MCLLCLWKNQDKCLMTNEVSHLTPTPSFPPQLDEMHAQMQQLQQEMRTGAQSLENARNVPAKLTLQDFTVSVSQLYLSPSMSVLRDLTFSQHNTVQH